jgi:hypothetical protein
MKFFFKWIYIYIYIFLIEGQNGQKALKMSSGSHVTLLPPEFNTES